jgi:hypothetical protein
MNKEPEVLEPVTLEPLPRGEFIKVVTSGVFFAIVIMLTISGVIPLAFFANLFIAIVVGGVFEIAAVLVFGLIMVVSVSLAKTGVFPINLAQRITQAFSSNKYLGPLSKVSYVAGLAITFLVINPL